jgi:hypothetical protein
MNAQNENRAGAGLCARCRYAETVTSSKGSTFVFCGLSRTDTRFPKYPRLPVLSCSGFVPQSPPTSPESQYGP